MTTVDAQFITAGRQVVYVGEEPIYAITLNDTPQSVTSVTVYDLTNSGADVTSTVMPTGSASINAAVVTLPTFKAFTAGRLYRIVMLYVNAGGVPLVAMMDVHAKAVTA